VERQSRWKGEAEAATSDSRNLFRTAV
jgi:hypothetical protein